MWARSSLEIDLVGTKVSPDCLAILARSLSPSVKGLMLGKTDFAKGGNDLSGLCVLCLALSDASSCAGLLSLDLSDNSLKPDAAVVLAKAMRVNASLTEVLAFRESAPATHPRLTACCIVCRSTSMVVPSQSRSLRAPFLSVRSISLGSVSVLHRLL